VEAVKKDPYSKGSADFSATELIESPRISILKVRHDADMVADVSDMMWSLFGQGVHSVLEKYGRKAGLHDYVEERLYAEIDGWRVSGGMDLWMDEDHGVVITDYKVTTTWAADGKPEWERQLNIYAYLFKASKGIRPNGLRVCAILRDWKSAQAKYDRDYPQRPVIMIHIPLWSEAEQLRYIRERIGIHASARASSAFDDELPLCTDDERWRRGESWALMKEGGKRASAVFDNLDLAIAAKLEKKNPTEYRVDHRPGIPLRCASFCDAAPFCSQWAREKDQYD